MANDGSEGVRAAVEALVEAAELLVRARRDELKAHRERREQRCESADSETPPCWDGRMGWTVEVEQGCKPCQARLEAHNRLAAARSRKRKYLLRLERALATIRPEAGR